MVEYLKHEGTSHSSSDLLKICVKMGASWSAQDFRQTGVTPSGSGAFLLLFSLAVFPLPGQKRPCQCMPGPVTFPLSLSGLDRASSVLPRANGQVLFGPTKTLGQSGPTGARGVVMSKGVVSPRVSTADHFIKLTAITTALKTFKILLA